MSFKIPPPFFFWQDLGSSELRRDIYITVHIIRIGKSNTWQQGEEVLKGCVGVISLLSGSEGSESRFGI